MMKVTGHIADAIFRENLAITCVGGDAVTLRASIVWPYRCEIGPSDLQSLERSTVVIARGCQEWIGRADMKTHL
jgi:hypothetical protein